MERKHEEQMPRHTLSRDLVYLFRPLWVSFRLSLILSKECLTGLWSFAMVAAV